MKSLNFAFIIFLTPFPLMADINHDYSPPNSFDNRQITSRNTIYLKASRDRHAYKIYSLGKDTIMRKSYFFKKITFLN